MLKSWPSMRIFQLIVLFVLVGVGDSTIRAQAGQKDANAPLASAPDATFDVASIKKSGPDEHGSGLYIYPGARVVGRGMTIRYLIAEAYGIDESQIVGGPALIDNNRFHIEAKPPDSVASRYTVWPDPFKAPPDEIRQMLQNLLAERFQLKVHVEQKNGKTYELVRNNRPLHLSPPKDKDAFPWTGAIGGGIPNGKGLGGRNISMPEMARWITRWLKCPVIDRTGLSGAYDFQVDSEAEETGLALFDTVSQSLREIGLALKKSRGTTYTLAVDQVSQPSSD